MKYGVVDFPQKGKGLIALEDCEEDETLFSEEPICSAQMAWGKKLNYKCCSRCMIPLESEDEAVCRLSGGSIVTIPKHDDTYYPGNIVTCSKSQQSFCDEKCRKSADMAYDRMLLPLRQQLDELDDLWRDIHFPPESASITLVYRLMAMRRLDPQIDEFINEKVLSENDTNIMHKMLGEEHSRNLLVLSDSLCNLFEDANDEEVKNLFGVLGRNQQGIGTCALTNFLNSEGNEEIQDQVYDAIEDNVGTSFMDNEGVGLYKTQSMANHSCRPNARIEFNDNSHKLSFVMNEDVAQGDEITISYIDGCTLGRSKRSRQEYLIENYQFKCSCERCDEEDTDDETDSENDCENDFEPDSTS